MSTIKHSQISALLVDDDAKLCGLLRDYLEGFGFSLDVAEDASSGLEKAVANEYDVILLDMMLPDMDGLDVLRRLAEIGSTPIVIFSAQDEEASRIVGLEMGADDYVPKAFSPRELLARVRAVLRAGASPCRRSGRSPKRTAWSGCADWWDGPQVHEGAHGRRPDGSHRAGIPHPVRHGGPPGTGLHPREPA